MAPTSFSLSPSSGAGLPFTSWNWVIRTFPCGKCAKISNCPPIARMKSASVLTYISARRSSFEMADCRTGRILDRGSLMVMRATLNSLSAISSRNLASFSSLRARDAGDIFASSPENFLAIFPYLFLPQLFDVLIVQPVCYRDEHVVPSVVARLVATDEQQCNPARVERVQHAIWLPAVLDAQLAHVVVL